MCERLSFLMQLGTRAQTHIKISSSRSNNNRSSSIQHTLFVKTKVKRQTAKYERFVLLIAGELILCWTNAKSEMIVFVFSVCDACLYSIKHPKRFDIVGKIGHSGIGIHPNFIARTYDK